MQDPHEALPASARFGRETVWTVLCAKRSPLAHRGRWVIVEKFLCFESIAVIQIDQLNLLCQSLGIKMDLQDNVITGRQIAAARTLLGLGQADLAERSLISVPTLKRMEASNGPAAGLANNVVAVRRALELAGVEFIAANGGGAGVRLRKRRAAHAK
jgi:hypothetical protein